MRIEYSPVLLLAESMAHRIWSQVALTVKRPLVVLVLFPAGDLQPNHIIRLR